MSERILRFIFIYEPAVRLAWAILRYLDSRRKHKSMGEFASWVWAHVIYGVVNGHIHPEEIDREWRKGKWFEETTQ